MDLYTISTSPDPNRQEYPPSAWLSDAGWPVPVLADSEQREAADAYGLTAFPYTVFVYSDGTIAARVTGGLSYDSFIGAVEFLAENPTG